MADTDPKSVQDFTNVVSRKPSEQSHVRYSSLARRG